MAAKAVRDETRDACFDPGIRFLLLLFGDEILKTNLYPLPLGSLCMLLFLLLSVGLLSCLDERPDLYA